MYSNTNKKGFSILDLVVRIIFAGLFIFILVWLFQKKVPNMTPFYSNVFRENIKYMQEAGQSYFTDDLMPKEVGATEKITLSEMINKKLILAFVDEDGKACDTEASYVSITKLDGEYELKTNLVCSTESDYTVKTLGCYTYCPNGNCTAKTCKTADVTKYQYKKLVSSTSTKYSCESGYKLSGKYCIKKVKSDTVSAKKEKVTEVTVTKDAKLNQGSSKTTQVSAIAKENTIKGKVVKNTNVDTKDATAHTTSSTTYSCPSGYTLSGTTCSKSEKKCTTTYETSYYTCGCSSTIGATGKVVTSCNTCSNSVPVEHCDNVNNTQKATPHTTTNTTYSCPSGYTLSGSKCNKTTYTYSCESGYTASGSGANTKCTKTTKTYSCPSGTISEGSGSSLKCYKVTSGDYYYTCDSGYTLSGTKCYKKEQKTSYEYTCAKGYTLEGQNCVKYTTEKTKAKSKKVTSKKYTYKWSEKTSLNGWTKTGKTKTVKGKEVCSEEI